MQLWVDGTSLLSRFAVQLRHLRAPDGHPTGGVYGACLYLFRQIAMHRPERMAVALDALGPTFRHRIDPAYKRHRGAWDPGFARQVRDLAELLAAAGIPVICVRGFEADDCIATLTALFSGAPTRIISGDRDLMALVSSEVVLHYTPPGVPLRSGIDVDPEWVRREYGTDPARLPELRVLLGDPGDGIQGVPGVGPAAARRLLARHPSLEQLLRDLEHGAALDSDAAALVPHAAAMRRSLALLCLRTDVPIRADSGFHLRPPHPALEAICRRHGFASWLRRKPWQVVAAACGGADAGCGAAASTGEGDPC